MTEPEFLTTTEAAELLRTHPNTLEIWRSRGTSDLPFVKVGHKVLYRRADINAWLRARTATGTREMAKA